MTTPSAALFGSGNVGFTRSATGVDLERGRPAGQPARRTASTRASDASYQSSWALRRRRRLAPGTACSSTLSAEYFAPVDRFTVLQGAEPDAVRAPPSPSPRSFEGVLNAGVGAEYWLGGVGADCGLAVRRDRALRRVRHRLHSASPEVEVARGLAPRTRTTTTSRRGRPSRSARSRFSLGVSYAFGSKRRDLGFGGPAAVGPDHRRGRARWT